MRMWHVQQEIFILKSVRRLCHAEELKVLRTVKNYRNIPGLSWEEMITLHDLGRGIAKSSQLLNRANERLCCFHRSVCSKERRVTGNMLELPKRFSEFLS